MLQHQSIFRSQSALDPHFKDRDDVLISGSGYLLLNTGDVGEFYPDLVFARVEVEPERIIRRNGYVISEVGKPPDFVLEVASRTTGRRDYTVKREGYARYGVGEYWRFDPTGGEYHDAPIGGDRLNEDGVYERIEIVSEPDGRHWGYSEALGLELWWDDKTLRFRDPVSGEFLPTAIEWSEVADAERERARAERERARAERERARAERERARAERERADVERKRADTAEARMAEMEAELRRLRGE